ncbi:hypothetical protein [Methylobacterium radiotolerans]|uniref:Uncharacterized protein n=1 Tax=Methylobacterium radiotolerans (strain ATCC 27329 / DSM 1819 / JCM 2831 / NBRC 15690 / NCIMB 10815 / 0-1) TaxID=426355 RepID=B1M1N3_METRJ|nr:hypothetical protein [Methylobacterium radiotolerans]ACB27616.1 conserved hypothetical protein [Methylobacterium radiotolerans JCM 2831]GEM95941.1 hypothetical protein MRA01_04810 [Methylobacterium radiotolerans]
MPFPSLIGGFLVKLLGSGIVAPVLAYLSKRSDNGVLTNGQNVTGDVTVAQAQLTAYVEERKVIAQERAEQHLSPWTAWMIPTAFGLCMIHFGAIVLDSTFRFNWQVAKLPAPYDAMEWSIVMAVIGVAGIAPTFRRIFGK